MRGRHVQRLYLDISLSPSRCISAHHSACFLSSSYPRRHCVTQQPSWFQQASPSASFVFSARLLITAPDHNGRNRTPRKPDKTFPVFCIDRDVCALRGKGIKYVFLLSMHVYTLRLHNNISCFTVTVPLTLWRLLLPYGYSYKASCVRPG